jgi:hypothetical protein
MKDDPSNIHRSTSSRAVVRTLVRANRITNAPRRHGLSRWRALEREQFLILVASPKQRARVKGGSRSC